MRKKRVYKKGVPGSEYDSYHASPVQKKRRAQRNADRAKAGLKVGDPREVDHSPKSRKSPSLGKKTRVISKKANRAKQPKRGK